MDFKPRDYQLQLLNYVKDANGIIYLPTGAGKTYLAILALKHFLNQDDSKKAIFIVPTVELAHQRARTVEKHTSFNVGLYVGSGSNNRLIRNKWYYQIATNQVLVGTAEIFNSLIGQNSLILNKVSLAIIDECHHARNQHPMHEFMQLFKMAKPDKLPRILGLTGVLLKGTFQASQIQEELERLEATLHASIITVGSTNDYDTVMTHSTKPQEKIILYHENRPFGVAELIENEIKRGCAELDQLKILHEPKRTSKGMLATRDFTIRIYIKNTLIELLHHLKDYGIFAAHVAIGLLVKEFDNGLKRSASSEKRNLFKYARRVCLNIEQILFSILSTYRKVYNEKKKYETLMAFASPKLFRFLQYLVDTFKNRNARDICCLIFVQRRYSVRLLYRVVEMFVAVRPELTPVLKLRFVVGRHSSGFGLDDVAECTESKLAIDQFTRRQCNVLICSSVLEEGIDIPMCNHVIVLDPLTTFSSYIQMKGRARSDGSVFAIFVATDEESVTYDRIAFYRATHEAIKKHLIKRMNNTEARPNREQPAETFHGPIQPFVSRSGAKLLASSAITLLNRYCEMLPASHFLEYKIVPSADARNFQVSVRLPLQSKITEPIIGDPMTCARWAKVSAAFKACIRLYEEGLITDNLQPTVKGGLRNIPQRLLHQDNGEGRTLRRTYDRLCPEELFDAMPVAGGLCYAYEIKFRPCFEKNDYNAHIYDMLRLTTNYGLLLRKRLPKLAEMPLFMNQGRICATISEQPIKISIKDSISIEELIKFHVMIFRDLLKLWKSYFAVDLRFEENAFLVVPLKGQSIDWSVVRKFQRLTPCRPYSIEEREVMIHCPDDYMGKIITTWYANQNQSYVVLKVLTDKSPESAFDTDSYSSYEDYIMQKYRKKVGRIVQKRQFLLEGRKLTSRSNFIINGFGKTENNLLSRKYMIDTLIPELCHNFMYPGDMWLKALLIPSVLYRVNFMLHADNLRRRFNACVGIKTAVAEQALYKPKPLTADESLRRVSDDRPKLQHLKSYPYFEVVRELATFLQQNEEIELKMWLEDKLPMSTPQLPEHMVPMPALIQVRLSTLIGKAQLGTTFNQLRINDVPRIEMLDRSRSEDKIYSSEQCDVLAALTAAGCKDIFDMERLELLGDSFLKFAISLYLANRFPNWNEGRLSKLKSHLVSNRNLVHCMLDSDIVGRICATTLQPNILWLPPLINIPQNLLDLLGKEPKLSVNELTTIELTEEDVFSGMLNWWEIHRVKRILMCRKNQKVAKTLESEMQNIMYTCLGKEVLTDKTVADTLEALLGVCVQSYGIQRSFCMLEFFGICQSEVGKPLSTLMDQKLDGALYRTNIPSQEVDQYLDNYRELERNLGYKFRDRAYLLQALTHPSYGTCCVTGSYQQLEFLGDAVLDLLVSCFIFERHVNMTPGKLTDLRSALVNNITLACVCVRNRFHHFMLIDCPKLKELVERFEVFQEQRNHCVTDQNSFEEELCAQHIDVPKVLGDIVEALIASIYLDSKDLYTTWKIIYRLLEEELKEFSVDIPISYVRRLYEHKTADVHFERGVIQNGVVMVKCSFKLHNRRIKVSGTGNSSYVAKKDAANKALKILAGGSF